MKSCARAYILHFFYLQFFFIISSTHAQNITLDWIQKKPHTIGRLVSFDKSGNIIACGTYGNSAPNWSDIITIKYDSLGTELWSATYDDTLFNGLDRCMALAIDSFNNVYVAGVTNLPYDFTFTNPQGVLIKYNSQGVFQWKKSWGNSAGFAASFNSMKLANDNEIYLSGYANPISTGDPHALLMKFDSSGVIQWLHVDSATVENYISQIDVDKAGNIYAVGTTSCCPPTYRMRLEKYRSDGTRQWEQVLFDTLYTYGWGGTVTLDDSANCYLVGSISYQFSPTAYDIGIAKIDSSANKKWFTPFFGDTSYYWAEGLGNPILNSKQEMFCSGSLSPITGGASHSLLVKINPISGAFIWINADTSRQGSISQLYNDTSALISYGFFTKNGILSLSFSICNQINGDTVWTESLFGGMNYLLYNLIFQNSNFYLFGYSYDPNFGQFYDSLILVKLNFEQLTTIRTNWLQLQNEIVVYPNPSSEFLTIKLRDKQTQLHSIKLFNITGKVSAAYLGFANKIDISNLQKGLYVLEAITNNGVLRKKIIIN